MSLSDYIKKLKRRNVIKSGVAYLVVSWLIIQITSIILPTFNAPPFVFKTLIFLLAIAFPIWLAFSWKYEITSDGLKKTRDEIEENSQFNKTDRRLNIIIISTLSITIILLIFSLSKSISIKPTNSDDIATTTDINEKSIAVLAFSDMSPKKDMEYFSDGISAEIIGLLGNVDELRVIDPRSSFTYKKRNITSKEIGKELNVLYLLDGSVRSFDNKVRIDVRLINALNGSNLWHEKYDRPMDDIFQIQEEIAQNVMKQLKIVLKSNQRERLEQIPTSNMDAYRLYLQGQYYSNLSGASNIEKSISLLNQAINLDPKFALAHALLAEVYITNNVGVIPNVEWEIKASEAINKALALDSLMAEAYVARGQWYWTPSNNFQHENAIKDFNKAIHLKPGLSSAYESLMYVQLHVGLLEKAIENGKKGIAIEPTSIWMQHYFGEIYFFTGKYLEAQKIYENISKEFIPFFRISLLAQIMDLQGEQNKAMKLLEDGLSKYPEEPLLNSTYGILLAKVGNVLEARKRMEVAIENQESIRHVHHLYHNLASASTLIGEDEKAVDWLILAAETGLPNYHLFNSDPNLNNLKSYPNFKQFMMDLKERLDHFESL